MRLNVATSASIATDPSDSSSDPFELDDAVEDVEEILRTPMKATPFYSLIQFAFSKVRNMISFFVCVLDLGIVNVYSS